jgi:hypothetical protein
MQIRTLTVFWLEEAIAAKKRRGTIIVGEMLLLRYFWCDSSENSELGCHKHAPSGSQETCSAVVDVPDLCTASITSEGTT